MPTPPVPAGPITPLQIKLLRAMYAHWTALDSGAIPVNAACNLASQVYKDLVGTEVDEVQGAIDDLVLCGHLQRASEDTYLATGSGNAIGRLTD